MISEDYVLYFTSGSSRSQAEIQSESSTCQVGVSPFGTDVIVVPEDTLPLNAVFAYFFSCIMNGCLEFYSSLLNFNTFHFISLHFITFHWISCMTEI